MVQSERTSQCERERARESVHTQTQTICNRKGAGNKTARWNRANHL